MENDHTNILMYDMLRVHGLSQKYFKNTTQDANVWKMSKYGILQKNYATFIERKNSKGYYDARTEFDFVTHFWEYLS